MSRLLLDTTVLIDADRSRASLEDVIGDDDEVAVAAITIAELLVGVELADVAHRAARKQFVDDIKDVVPVVDYDTSIARSHAQLLVVARRQGRPRVAHDLIIAATALATQREVVSADPSAFHDLPGVSLRSYRS